MLHLPSRTSEGDGKENYVINLGIKLKIYIVLLLNEFESITNAI